MSTDFEVRPSLATIEETIASLDETGRPIYLMIADGKRLKGYVRLDPGFKLWQRARAGTTLGDMARTDFVLARPTDTMFDVIGRVARRGARLAIVVAARRACPASRTCSGFIALETMGEAVIENARAYAPAGRAQSVPAALPPPRRPPASSGAAGARVRRRRTG